MNVLVLGKGGREHALSWKLSESPLIKKLFCAPGNDGMFEYDQIHCVDMDLKDIKAIKEFIKKEKVELVVVGPEDLLAAGIVDELQSDRVAVFGPSQKASELESSKAFSKNLMRENGIPTAEYEEFTDAHEAREYVKKVNWPNGYVIKCDGLAAGKGVIVCKTINEANEAIDKFLVEDSLGLGNKKIVLEECLVGREVSFFALCSNTDSIPLGLACDYKALKDGGKGPNTGGMGAYSPPEWLSEADKNIIQHEIVDKTLNGMKKKGTPFTGVLFVGVMVTEDGPKVLEYNVRFGDPETQVLMPMIESDLVPYFQKAAKGELSTLPEIKVKNCFGVHVVKAARGYPGTEGTAVKTGDVISWVKKDFKKLEKEGQGNIFFAGVKKHIDSLYTNGGRVLGITTLGEDLEEARKKAYELAKEVCFNDEQMREDIGLHD